jgi:hypothetical protein
MENQFEGARSKEIAAKARTTTRILNVLGFLVTLWGVFFPIPYAAAVICCLILPLIAVCVMAFAKGLVNLNSARRSKDPHVAIAFVGPCIALLFRAVFDFQFVSYQPALIPTLAVGAALTAVTYFYAPDLRKKWLNLLVVMPFALCYGYGLFVQSNCLQDTSRPTEYSSRIVNKRISNGSRGGKYYYLDILPCGPITTTRAVRVSRTKYDRYTIGEEILVRVKEGTLGAKWFYITPMRRAGR